MCVKPKTPFPTSHGALHNEIQVPPPHETSTYQQHIMMNGNMCMAFDPLDVTRNINTFY